jgi:hypothetical protein
MRSHGILSTDKKENKERSHNHPITRRMLQYDGPTVFASPLYVVCAWTTGLCKGISKPWTFAFTSFNISVASAVFLQLVPWPVYGRIRCCVCLLSSWTYSDSESPAAFALSTLASDFPGSAHRITSSSADSTTCCLAFRVWVMWTGVVNWIGSLEPTKLADFPSGDEMRRVTEPPRRIWIISILSP